MHLTPRQLAKASNNPKYETGQPCKNGHIVYRYTKNGSCSACINGIRKGGKPPQFDDKNKSIIERFITIGLRAFEGDYKRLCDIVYACALLRMPNVPRGVIETRIAPKDHVSGTAFYSFFCHEDDIAILRQASNDLLRASGPTSDQLKVMAAQAIGVRAERIVPVNPTPMLVDDKGKIIPGAFGKLNAALED
jgi:hypothetical protein